MLALLAEEIVPAGNIDQLRHPVASGHKRINPLDKEIAARERLTILPEIPTTAEAGFAGVEGSGWNGIFVPAGTPPAVIVKLQQEIRRVLFSKEIQDDALTLGTQAGGESPEEFAAFVRAEVQKWGRVIKEAGIKPE